MLWVAPLIYCITTIVLWQVANAVFVPELLANRLFEILPVSFIEFGVQSLGALAKKLAFVNIAAIYFCAYWLFSANWGRLRAYLGNAFYASFALWGVNVLILFPATGKGVFGYKLPQGALSASVFVLAAHWIFARMLQMHRTESTAPSKTGRRLFIASVVIAAIAAVGRAYRVLLKPAKWSEEITAAEDFYTVSKNSVDPVVPVAGWKLEIRGLIERPASFTLAELSALPSITIVATLACISNPVGGDWIGNARWTGIPLWRLLEAAGIADRARDVVFHGADGYTDSIPIERALHPLTILAYAMNDAPLQSSHGFPLRLIVPGIYGMKNVKWIEAIELVDRDYRGFWQQRGWDETARYKLMSRIDVAKDGLVAGIAFAGDRGIGSVEVKIGDQPWRGADLRPALSPLSWVLWSLHADIKGKGVMVRAIAADGEIQAAQPMPPFPEGASGLHTVTGS